MMKTAIAALMMAMALTACNKSPDTPPPSSSSGANTQSGAAAPQGLGGLGGGSKTK